MPVQAAQTARFSKSLTTRLGQADLTKAPPGNGYHLAYRVIAPPQARLPSVKPFVHGQAAQLASATDALTYLADFLRAFEECTGWPLRFVETADSHLDPEVLWAMPVGGRKGTLGELRLELGGSPAIAGRRIDLEVAAELATSYAGLLNSLIQTQYQLRRSQAELATAVPLVARRGEPKHIASRLEASLATAVRSVSVTAAGLYLLDDATTQLKLRVAFGLPASRLAEPARRLADAVADLEAMAGHAVVLETPDDMETWAVPESCDAAVCVPVSSSTQILGTLWLFDERPRAFDDRDVAVAEAIAGRLALELEREILLNELAQREVTPVG